LLFPVEPEELLVVDHIAFPLEQNMQTPIAGAATLVGDRLHALAKGGIIRPGRLGSHGHTAAVDGFNQLFLPGAFYVRDEMACLFNWKHSSRWMRFIRSGNSKKPRSSVLVKFGVKSLNSAWRADCPKKHSRPVALHGHSNRHF
jgi:hypothetical protein